MISGGHYFAVDDCVRRKSLQRFDQLGETMSNFIHCARIDGHALVLDVSLRPNSIKLVLDKKLVGHCACDVGKINAGSGEHELDRMKEPHSDLFQIISPRAHCSLADVAQ